MPALRHLTFQGDKAVELRTRALRLVAVTSRGPRLAFLGRPDGDNLLYWVLHPAGARPPSSAALRKLFR